ncbi:MAG: pyridoxal phosphate-dependent aminotransferase [Deltaproteobacteria bacterium]|nr:pyridoxal phosphate-dependent aminotransferase [Deltaproteobacteria bacterium]
MKFSERMSRLGTETAFDVLAEVNGLKAQGKDIISFSIGEPDFDTPENIVNAAIAALKAGQTHYNPSAGLLELRRVLAEYISRTREIEVEPEEVVVTPGAKPIIFHTILSVVDPGDEVIYPNPGFPIYESMINYIGAKAVPMPLLENRGFSLDVDHFKEIINDRTKLIILNSPNNPTGGIVPQEDLEVIAELAEKHDAWVLSDEVYSQMVYDRPFRSISSIPGMRDRTVIIDGCSKTYAMTGWRIGFGVGNKEIVAGIARLVTNAESCTATFTQYAAIEAYSGDQAASRAMIKEFNERRDIIVDGLNEIEGITCMKPEGAFYVFPNVTGACRRIGAKDSSQFAHDLLHQAGVAVLGRTCFGGKNENEDQEYVRFSYASSKDDIREGLKRIKAFVEK